MKKITIINAYGDKNIGDAAILNVAVNLIKKAYNDNCHISILSENGNVSKSLGKQKKVTAYQMPYGYAIHSNQGKPSTVTKITRFIEIFAKSILKVSLNSLGELSKKKSGITSYINAIKQADLVVGIGGGYFITKSNKDYFGLLLTLLPLYMAKFYRKKIIFLPISFGPFASKLQEKICYQALKNTTIMTRDNISLNQIKQNDKANKIDAFYAPDLALLFDTKDLLLEKTKKNYMTLTAREWLPSPQKQQAYEEPLGKLVDFVWKNYRLKTVFVVMSSNTAEDDDFEIAKRILQYVKDKKCFEIRNPSTLKEAVLIFKNAKVSVCTRMHSAILSAISNTPFIPIGYGHKTKGFVQNFGIENWHIDIGDVTFKKLTALVINLFKIKNYSEFKKQLQLKQEENIQHTQKIISTLSEEYPDLYKNTIPSLSVGIAAYNAGSNIRKLLKSLLNQKALNFKLDKILIYSDASSDKTVERIKQIKSNKIQLISRSQRLGFAHAVHELMKISKSDITVLLNDDIIIKDKFFLNKTTAYFFKDPNLGLLCANPLPFRPKSFIENAITSGINAYNKTKEQIKSGNTALTCDGKTLIVSRKFINSFNFPKDYKEMANVDGYLYFSCIQNNLNYKYAKDAIVYYKCPSTTDDLIKWTLRNNNTRKILVNKFGKGVNREYKLPLLLFTFHRFVELMKNPFGGLYLFIISLYCSFKTNLDYTEFNPTWSIVKSTKSI